MSEKEKWVEGIYDQNDSSGGGGGDGGDGGFCVLRVAYLEGDGGGCGDEDAKEGEATLARVQDGAAREDARVNDADAGGEGVREREREGRQSSCS